MCTRTLKSSHRPDGKTADALASTLACTTVADALVNYSKYVLQRTSNFPNAPMGDSRFARCFQGGGVYVTGGTVSIVNSQIYSNTASQVRASHACKLPIAPMGKCLVDMSIRFSSFMMGAASNYQYGVRAICA